MIVDPIPDGEIKCHNDGTRHRLCKDLRGTCGMWIKLPRKIRKTGEDVDEYHCGDVWNVILQAEALREMAGLHAALNSFRNETVKRSDGVLHLAAEMLLAKTAVALPAADDKMRVIENESHDSSRR